MSLSLKREMLWHTMDGQVLAFSEMETTHLFNSLRMIFNHRVPAAYRVNGGKRYALGPQHWPIQTCRDAMAGLLLELKSRQRPTWMDARLREMRDRMRLMRNSRRQLV